MLIYPIKGDLTLTEIGFIQHTDPKILWIHRKYSLNEHSFWGWVSTHKNFLHLLKRFKSSDFSFKKKTWVHLSWILNWYWFSGAEVFLILAVKLHVDCFSFWGPIGFSSWPLNLYLVSAFISSIRYIDISSVAPILKYMNEKCELVSCWTICLYKVFLSSLKLSLKVIPCVSDKWSPCVYACPPCYRV